MNVLRGIFCVRHWSEIHFGERSWNGPLEDGGAAVATASLEENDNPDDGRARKENFSSRRRRSIRSVVAATMGAQPRRLYQ